ncbi:MAG: endopeptidase La [Deltaproteobacteria bacterium]|nr:endopeptidase La [Deltaproteobacteria bacterium]
MPEPNPGELLNIPELLPIIPVRDIVVFPFMMIPLFVTRDLSSHAVDEALAADRLVLMLAQKQQDEDTPGKEGMYLTGTVGMILRMRKMPDGRTKILVQGLVKARVTEFVQESPCFKARVTLIREVPVSEISTETEAILRSVRNNIAKLQEYGKNIPQEISSVIQTLTDPGRLADLVMSNLGAKVADSEDILEEPDPVRRLRKVNEFLVRELEIYSVQLRIQGQVKQEIDKSQREYYLREQMRAIQHELGLKNENEDLDELHERLKAAALPKEASDEAERQFRRLHGMHSDSAEATVTRTYLEWLADLPWSKSSEDVLDLKKAHKILDEDHYDLARVKERILEFLGVRQLKKDHKGPLLCFVGPPGVGKTSLGRSIARCMGRQFARISLGGVRDEAEIRGHRRTYVGAMPGRIVQSLKQAGTNNPVFMLDEVDKLGADYRGDPSAALLEVLDPEQNYSFTDHYLNVAFDLSKVMFIATANHSDPIPAPLKDRMEIIHLPGYTEEEKVAIAFRHLIPRQTSENGVGDPHIKFLRSAVQGMVRRYTREAGLRNLEREIASICRKTARAVVEGRKDRTTVRSNNLARFLGPPKYLAEEELTEHTVGLATGLAWTQYGGEILHVESTSMKGRPVLTLTGHLGEVMKESAHAALSYTRTHARSYGIDERSFSDREIHIHVPAGAIPKDGPSAGVAMVTSLVSLLTQTPARRDVAITGEITLRGRVLPVGGIKEKLLAATRAGIFSIVIPEQNEKDLVEIDKKLLSKMKIVLARDVNDVIAATLLGGLPKTGKGRKTRGARRKAKKH